MKMVIAVRNVKVLCELREGQLFMQSYQNYGLVCALRPLTFETNTLTNLQTVKMEGRWKAKGLSLAQFGGMKNIPRSSIAMNFFLSSLFDVGFWESIQATPSHSSSTVRHFKYRAKSILA